MLDLNWSKIAEAIVIMVIGSGSVWLIKTVMKVKSDLDHAFIKIRALEAKSGSTEGSNGTTVRGRNGQTVAIQNTVGVRPCGDCPYPSGGGAADHG